MKDAPTSAPRPKLYTVKVYRWSRVKDNWILCGIINPFLPGTYRSADAAARAGQHQINEHSEQAWEAGIDADLRAPVVYRKGAIHSIPYQGPKSEVERKLREVVGLKEPIAEAA